MWQDCALVFPSNILKYDIDTHKQISYVVFCMVISISFGLDSSSLPGNHISRDFPLALKGSSFMLAALSLVFEKRRHGSRKKIRKRNDKNDSKR